jgi:hypothetical protein
LALVFVVGKLPGLTKIKGWSHIHVHSCANAASIALFNSILTGCTYSMTLHGLTLELYGPNQEQKWKNAAFAIVISHIMSGSITIIKPQLGATNGNLSNLELSLAVGVIVGSD